MLSPAAPRARASSRTFSLLKRGASSAGASRVIDTFGTTVFASERQRGRAGGGEQMESAGRPPALRCFRHSAARHARAQRGAHWQRTQARFFRQRRASEVPAPEGTVLYVRYVALRQLFWPDMFQVRAERGGRGASARVCMAAQPRRRP